MALHFFLEGLRRGKDLVYHSFGNETGIAPSGRSHDGRSINSGLGFVRVESLLRPKPQRRCFHPSEVELTKVSQLLLMKCEGEAKRVAFDSLSNSD